MPSAGWKVNRTDQGKARNIRRQEPSDVPQSSDKELLAQAYRQVIPLKGHHRVTHEPPRHEGRPSAQTLNRRARSSEAATRVLGPSDGDPHTFAQPLETYRTSGVSAQALRRLRRDAARIREQLDLHGLTRDQARAMVLHFVKQAHSRGINQIIIIHGQGYGSTGGSSVLRQLTRHWLTQMPEVLGFITPNPAQGGKGAVAVLLRST